MKHQTALPGEVTPVPPIAQTSANRSVDSATLELLANWRLEDATKDPEEIQAAEKELAEFKKAMNDNRARSGEPLLYP
jgi:hypothetical protein